MKVCLIDADSKIPNLALMKLSAYHKAQGDEVTLYQAHLPYYPNKKKKIFRPLPVFDKYYCSVVFEGNKNFIQGDAIEFGGTGYSLDINLPDEIEKLLPDYSIYPDNDISYGFITRGCIRNCGFCYVPKKEGSIRQVCRVDEVAKHKKVKFLDNNILAYSGHKVILQELVWRQIKCCFNQGLDIRLLDSENSELLSKLKYLGEYVFAFDDYSYLQIIEEKIKVLSWRKPWQLKFFVYCDPVMQLSNVVKRIEWLKENKCLPYVMRNISCWGSKHSDFYVDIAAWTNQVHLFKTISFAEFLDKRHKNKERIEKSKRLYIDNA